jgi:hypothetical protein
MSPCRIRFAFSALIFASCAMLGADTPAAATATIQGHVFSADGTRLGSATVTIEGTPGSGSRFVAVTDSGTDPGHYSSPALAAGTYTITASKEGYSPKAPTTVTLGADSRVIDFVLDSACSTCGSSGSRTGWNWDFEGTFLIVVLFLASIFLVRWHNIALPNREMLLAEIQNARVRFENNIGKPPDGNMADLLMKAEEAIAWHWARTPLDFLFWSRGQEITGWSRIREFQRDSVKLLADGSIETIRARLQSVELDLLDIDKTHAKTIASNIKDALDKNLNENTLRPLLMEALTYVNDEDVNTFAQLVGWQTKAVWLSGVGCGLLVVLSFVVGNPVLFIAGAAGGYLSRLARTLKRADVPTDYGASWTTLFLSPIVGALSGWFGILLIVVLADNKMKVLGEAFAAVKWGCPFAPFTLGIAFALGFSERLFDGIVSSLEDKVDSDRSAAKKPQQPTSGVSGPQGAAPPDPKQGQGVAPVVGPAQKKEAPPAVAGDKGVPGADPKAAPPVAGDDKSD